ncbi:MAG: PAS domain-containing protein [Sulfuricellaceae bacterium]
MPLAPAASPPSLLRSTLPFLLLVAALLVLTVATIGHNFNQQRDKEMARLQAIADLKARQIGDWLKDKQGDAEFMQSGQYFAASYRNWRAAGDLSSRDLLQTQLEQFRQYQGYSAVMLLGPRGERLWGSADAPSAIAPLLREAVRQAAVDQRIHRVGPYRGLAGTLRLDFVVSLRAADSPSPLVVLHIAPTDWLHRTLQSWPAPSASGETLLFQRDDDQVLYLNELRHRRDTALKLRVPLATPKLLAAQVLRGEAGLGGLIDGVDYRGVPSLGVAQAILDTDWYLIAKLDRAEFYRAAARDTLWIGLAGLLTLFMAAAGFNLLRQRQQLALAADMQQSQAQRLHALNLLAAIADSSEDAIFAKDMEGRYTLFNRAAGIFSGKPPEAVLGRDERAIFPPELAERVMAVNRRVIAENRTITQEETLDTPNGERVCLATKGPLRDAEGKVIGIFGIVHDITERKQADAALRASELSYRSLFENMINGYAHCRMLFDNGEPRDFVYLDVNQAFEAQTGLHDVVGKKVSEVIPGICEADPGLFEIYGRVAQSGRPERFETYVEALRMWFSISVYSPRREHFVALFDVITERKQAELALHRQTEELTQRNAELERFNRAVVGRELEMIALKQQVNALSIQLGREAPFALSFLDAPTHPLELEESAALRQQRNSE